MVNIIIGSPVGHFRLSVAHFSLVPYRPPANTRSKYHSQLYASLLRMTGLVKSYVELFSNSLCDLMIQQNTKAFLVDCDLTTGLTIHDIQGWGALAGRSRVFLAHWRWSRLKKNRRRSRLEKKSGAGAGAGAAKK